jgi:hypothetical protein
MNIYEKNAMEMIINSLRKTQKKFRKIVNEESDEELERDSAIEYLMSLESILWHLELEYNGKLTPEDLKGSRSTDTLTTIAHSLYYEVLKPLCAVLNDTNLPIEERIIASDKLKFVENILAVVKREYEEIRYLTNAIPFDELFGD